MSLTLHIISKKTLYFCLLVNLVAGDALIARTNNLDLTGIWERTHYGDIYVFKKKRITIYQYTRETCYLAYKFNLNDLSSYFSDIQLDKNNEYFTAIDPDEPAFRMKLDRLDSLPTVCNEEYRLIKFSPIKVFEHVWHTFNDYYAFFKQRNVSWQNQYNKYVSSINDDTSKHILFSSLKKLLSVIDDGHIDLDSPFDNYSPEQLRGVDLILSEGYKKLTTFIKYKNYKQTQLKTYEKILTKYFDKNSFKRAGGPKSNKITWATINKNIAYLRIDEMSGISKDPEAYSIQDVEAMNKIMNKIISESHDTKGMILDVRFNGGGDDLVGMAIANHFTDKQQLAVSKIARSYRGETDKKELYFRPSNNNPYLKPVILIAGADSASATEVFIMAMRALETVTLIGEPTNGILSDELYKKLPKGWSFALSNEIYFDAEGNNYEGTGIPPDINILVFSLDEIHSGKNSALEIAINLLNNK